MLSTTLRMPPDSLCSQVAHVLFEELKLPTPRRSRKQLTEQHSTSEKVLLALKEHHPLPALILGALSPYQLQVEDLLTPQWPG